MSKSSRKMILASMLVALDVILERFLAIQVESNHYNIAIVTIVFAAIYLGAPYALSVAALGDIVGALIAPSGPYFPGFTFTNIVAAICLALFMEKKVTVFTVSASIVINKLICTLVLNSLWVSILYRGGVDAFPAYLVTRIPQAIIMGVIEIALLIFVFHDKSKIRHLLDKNMKTFRIIK